MAAGTVALRLRMLALPLNRDEGEYAYVARLLLEGTPPYAEAYSMRLPGIYLVYAAIQAALGEGSVAVHLGLALASAATTVIVFLLGRRLGGEAAGLAAAAVWGILSVNRHLLGFAAYTEHFVVLLALPGLLLALRARDSGRAWPAAAAGGLLALALLVKQPAVFFLLLGLAVVVAPGSPRRAALALAAGAAVPAVATLAWLAVAGVLDRFWFWTVRYASAYVTLRDLASVPGVLGETLGPFGLTSAGFLGLAAAGVVALGVGPARASSRAFLAGLAGASGLAVAAGLYFRPHYFVLALPVVALVAGQGAAWLGPRLVPGRGAGLAVALLVAAPAAHAVLAQGDVLFWLEPHALAREVYHANPYPEAVEIGRRIREATGPGERVAVIGSEPEIYVHAGRRGATGHLYMYPLMERQPYARAMQEEMIREVEAARPAWLVVVWVGYSWMAAPDSEPLLLRWLEGYRRAFERVGVADIVSTERTEWRWGPAAAAYAPRARYWVEVLRRRPAQPPTSWRSVER